jgi:hypothetical protein
MPNFYPILIKFAFSGQIFHKVSNVNFVTYLSSNSLVDTCRWMDGQTDGPSDMIKLTDTLYDCVNVPKMMGLLKF